jgi:DNA-binding transcriptional regulator YiaG
MKMRYESELLGAIHETAVGLHKIGVINDKEMKDYDKDCLVKKPDTILKTENSAEMEHHSHVTA